MPTTIKDVARACGVSAATVSYVLNDSRTVRPQTRERILDAVRSLDYHPSAVARGLSRKRMDTLGVVFPASRAIASPITSSYYAPLLDGILEVARRHRQNVTLFQTRKDDSVRRRLAAYRDGRCDGLLLLGAATTDPAVDALAAASLPFVVISSRSDDPRICRVDVDNEASTRAMTQHLLALGHRRIAAVMPPPEQGTYVGQRIAGWRAALAEAGLAPDARDLLQVQQEPGSADALADSVLSWLAETRPTALLCLRDLEAFRVLEALAARGVRVPEQISVVGFDDRLEAARTSPPLTTVRQPLRDKGVAAAEMLLALIAGDTPPGQIRLLPTEIVVRQSAGPPPLRM